MEEKLKDDYFMSIALTEAKIALENGDVPVGAVIVKNKIVIARAHNQRESLNNPLKHAELICIEMCAKKLKTWRLDNCVIYVTMEPCLMCLGALYEVRIRKLVYGISNTRNYIQDVIAKAKYNHKLEIHKGILADKCSNILQTFLNGIRGNE